MDFPIIGLIDDRAAEWLLVHYHLNGLHLLHCGACVKEACDFGTTEANQLQIYRCLVCDGTYNFISQIVQPYIFLT